MDSTPADPQGVQPPGWTSARLVRLCTGGQGRPAAMLAVVLLTVGYLWLGEAYWRPLRHLVFDAYQARWPRQVDQFPVVIVDIDEASLAALGQWPWPRTRLARLIEATQRLGALAVGLDIVMPEADHVSPDVFIAERSDVSPALREALSRLPSNDALLAETLNHTPVVVGRAGISESPPHSMPVDAQTPVRIHGEMPMTRVQTYAGHLTNMPQIEAAASGYGYLNATPDKDGAVRTMPLLVAIQGELAPTLGLELLRVATGEAWYSVHASRHRVDGVQIGETFIPTDPNGRIHLYFSAPDARRRVSALAVLNDAVRAQALHRHIAVIGVTALGLTDVAVTPVSARMDGVEIQVQALENILSGTWLVRPWQAPWVEVLAAVLSAALLIALFPRVQPVLGTMMWLGITAMASVASLLAFLYARTLFDPSFPAVSSALVLMVLLTAGLAVSNRRRRELRAALEAERIERLRVAGELQAARDIQLGMLPTPGSITGLPDNIAFYALLEPAKEVGGDLYDAFMLDEQHFFFLIGDVAGKGVPASLFMALSKTLCKSTALRQRGALDALMTAVNQEISRDNPAALFVTAVAGIIDTRTGAMELSSAGHDAPIVLRLGEAPHTLPAAGGPPLCVLEQFPYAAEKVQLQDGDLLLMITDGVTEAHDPDQKLYGLARLLTYCATLTERLSIEALCQGLYADVQHFVQGAEPSDDVTIMAIRFTEPMS